MFPADPSADLSPNFSYVQSSATNRQLRTGLALFGSNNLTNAAPISMAADAVRLGERLEYRGVGTVEFIVGADEYHFLEVNPRLQVEHPVTEMVTGLDIVEIMLRIASGEGLPVQQGDVRIHGHAVEARICAEDPAAGFLPSTGKLSQVRFPDLGVRVETGIESGMEVTPYYDSMLAKLITHAPTRDEALDRLSLALEDTVVFGVTTNRSFLRRLLDDSRAPYTFTARAGSDVTSERRLMDYYGVRTLDGFGALGEPPVTAKPIARDFNGPASADHPPGFYGPMDSMTAINTLKADADLSPADYPAMGLSAQTLALFAAFADRS